MTYASEIKRLRLDARNDLALESPVIMGILNVTPDSFSDGGLFIDTDHAVARALAMVEQGATLIDVGGESTRPGAQSVSVGEELKRVIPMVENLSKRGIKVSIDTSKPEVMRAAAAAGALMINDVRALRAPGAIEAAAETDLAVCLMHMLGEPGTMQEHPVYEDVVAEVLQFLLARAQACEEAGIVRARIVLDPGFGFGKTLQHNLALLAGLGRIVEAGYPVLAGLSRKSMLGALTGRPVNERLAGSLALASLSAWLGAHIIRVHDVAETRDALAVINAVRTGREKRGIEA